MFTKIAPASVVFSVTVLILIVMVFLFVAQQSRKAERYRSKLSTGLSQLKPCENKPNCVCSEHKDDKKHYIAPLHYKISDVAIMKKILPALESMGGKLTIQESHYVAVEFKSRLFGFVDDLEVRIDSESKHLHFRSASRQGHSDFKVNRRRVNNLKLMLNQ